MKKYLKQNMAFIKYLFTIIGLFAFSSSIKAAVGEEVKINGVRYIAISDSTAEASIINSEPNIVIPGHVNISNKSLKVVTIEGIKVNYKKRDRIVSIVLPNTLRQIADRAFQGTAITAIAIPNTVQEIGERAFEGCRKLKTISLSTTLKSIPKDCFNGCSALREVNIPLSVESIGQSCFEFSGLRRIIIPTSVKKIGLHAFSYCYSLEEVTIPNSVTEMEIQAFTSSENIKKIVLPDKKPHFIGGGPIPGKPHMSFKDGLCLSIKNLQEVRGNTSPICPRWAMDDILYSNGLNINSDNPFVQKFFKPIVNSFSYYANDKVIDEVEKWQQKKEYETTAQWRTRVTEETRKVKVQATLEALKKEYIKERSSKGIKALIGTYDADYATFPVYMAGLDTVYVKVPQAQAPNFKEHWTDVRLYPKYGVVNDQLALLSCSFKLNGNTFQTLKSYAGDNSNAQANELLANLSPLEIDFSAGQDQKPTNKDTGMQSALAPVIKTDDAIDKNIPVNPTTNKNTFVVIIGNEDYQRVSKVNYALNDAGTFANYCQKTLGIPQQNIRSYSNATYGTMLSALDDIKGIATAYHGNLDIIFYYAGHGIPSETDKSAYLLPVDADGIRTEVCLSTKTLYQTLSELNAKNVVVFMDACFSGAQRGEGMLASARGVALKVKADVPQGNTVVFSAASGEETAFPYKEKGHGMFTYFLLKKLQETKGDATLGEIGEYVSEEVAKQSIVINHKSQTPTIIASEQIDNWKEIKLKK